MEKVNHYGLYDMPDIAGNNRDHDNRYIIRRQRGIVNPLEILERSTDPSDPSEGSSVVWMSDGTGSGDDGDLMVKVTYGGTTYTRTLSVGKPKYLTANGITLNTGTSSDALSDLQTLLDGNVYAIDEVTGVPGFDLEIDFTGVTNIDGIIVNAYYAGTITHDVVIQLYNYNDTAWDSFMAITDGLSLTQYYFTVPDDTDYISSGAAIVRIYHVTTGNAAHDIYIDYVALKYLA